METNGIMQILCQILAALRRGNLFAGNGAVQWPQNLVVDNDVVSGGTQRPYMDARPE